MFKIRAKVKHVGSKESYGSKGFVKRQVVLSTPSSNPQYENLYPISFNQEHADNFPKVGDEAEVRFVVRGSEYNGKYYTDLVALGYDLIQETSKSGAQANEQFLTPQNVSAELPDASDDLPF